MSTECFSSSFLVQPSLGVSVLCVAWLLLEINCPREAKVPTAYQTVSDSSRTYKKLPAALLSKGQRRGVLYT